MNDKKLEALKKEYKTLEMSKEQVIKMKKNINDAKKSVRNNKIKQNAWKVAAACALIAFLLLPNLSKDVAYAMSSIPVLGKLVEVVTFRDYQYEDDHHTADINVPELIADETDSEASESLKKTTDEINAEIQSITDKIVEEFEADLKNKEGYQDVIVQHEVLSSNEEYFTLKLICYQGAGSGAQWNYFYTIDLKTGERLALKDLFTKDADYISVISDNINAQMKEQMEADENVIYWLDDEISELNFDKISDETSFYLNADKNLVICFNEGDVAPMYMGCVEFVIPNEVLGDILK